MNGFNEEGKDYITIAFGCTGGVHRSVVSSEYFSCFYKKNKEIEAFLDHRDLKNMIGIVIVGHSNISKEFLVALEHIVGKQENVVAISIFPNDDIKKREEIIKSVKKVNKGKGVVVLTDMFGGTPQILLFQLWKKKRLR